MGVALRDPFHTRLAHIVISQSYSDRTYISISSAYRVLSK